MNLVDVLLSNGYVSLKENEQLLFKKLAPSPLRERKIVIGDDDLRLLYTQKVVELNQFNELEALPNFPKHEQLLTYIEYELELNYDELNKVS